MLINHLSYYKIRLELRLDNNSAVAYDQNKSPGNRRYRYALLLPNVPRGAWTRTLKAWILEIPITKPMFEKGHQYQSSNAIFSCFYMFDSRWAMGMQICTNLC